MIDRFSIDEFLKPVELTPPGSTERLAALQAAHQELGILWPHLTSALAQRAAVLIEQQIGITSNEINTRP